MLFVSQSLTDNLSAEGFYQLEWDQTVIDNCGTFFSQPDVISDGCDNNLAVCAPAMASTVHWRLRACRPGCVMPASIRSRQGRDLGRPG